MMLDLSSCTRRLLAALKAGLNIVHKQCECGYDLCSSLRVPVVACPQCSTKHPRPREQHFNPLSVYGPVLEGDKIRLL